MNALILLGMETVTVMAVMVVAVVVTEAVMNTLILLGMVTVTVTVTVIQVPTMLLLVPLLEDVE